MGVKPHGVNLAQQASRHCGRCEKLPVSIERGFKCSTAQTRTAAMVFKASLNKQQAAVERLCWNNGVFWSTRYGVSSVETATVFR